MKLMKRVGFCFFIFLVSFIFVVGCENMKNVKYYEDLTDEQVALLAEANLSISSGEQLNEDQLYLLELSTEVEEYLKNKYGRDFTVIAVFKSGLMETYTEFWAEPVDEPQIYEMAVTVKMDKSGGERTYTDDYAAYYAYDIIAEQIEGYFDDLYGIDNIKIFTTTSCVDWMVFDGSQTAEELVNEKVVDFYSAVILSDSCMSSEGMEDAVSAVLDQLEEWGMVGGMHLYLASAEDMASVNQANYKNSEQSEKWLAYWTLSLNADGVRRAHSMLNDN